MVLIELQFRSSNFSKLFKKGSKLNGRSTSDEKWQPSKLKESNRLKEEFGIVHEPRHNCSCKGLYLRLKFCQPHLQNS